jgi:type VI secretion system protein ImpF
MARAKSEILILQSLMDRLTDSGSDDWPTTRASSLRMYRDGIKRDVEWLLNSRQPRVTQLVGYPLASVSVFNYGLPDLTQFAGHGHDPEGLLMAILQTVRNFEPRIRDPRVFLQRTDVLNRSLRFHVEGRLVFENGEEDISFDTVLEIISGQYEVK